MFLSRFFIPSLSLSLSLSPFSPSSFHLFFLPFYSSSSTSSCPSHWLLFNCNQEKTSLSVVNYKIFCPALLQQLIQHLIRLQLHQPTFPSFFFTPLFPPSPPLSFPLSLSPCLYFFPDLSSHIRWFDLCFNFTSMELSSSSHVHSIGDGKGLVV